MGEAREAAGTRAGPEVGTMPAPDATKKHVWTSSMLQVFEEFGVDPAECENSDTGSGVSAAECSEAVNPSFKIRLPPRKVATPADLTKGAPAATDSQPDVPSKQSSLKRKHICPDPESEDNEGPISDVSESQVEPSKKKLKDSKRAVKVIQKRCRGRPPAKKSQRFAVPIFVLVAVPPKIIPGKTHKGDKTVKQNPITAGPFSLTRKTRWVDFVELVANAIGVEKENVNLNAMTWHYQNKASQALPLKSEGSFDVMRKNVKSLKDASSQVIFVNHPIVKTRLLDVELEVTETPVTRTMGNTGIWDKKLGLDDELSPVIRTLEECYPPSTCSVHPDIRCYQYSPRSNDMWHFELNSIRLKVWAHAILQKRTDYNVPPIGSNHFLPKDKLRDGTSKKPLTPQPQQQPLPAMLPPVHPAPYHPYHSPMPPVYPLSWPTVQSPIFGMPGLNFGPIPDMAGLPHHTSIREWCTKHGLGEEEYQGLVKLGFRAGDDLEKLDDSSWRWANLGPLHKQRIIAACLSANN